MMNKRVSISPAEAIHRIVEHTSLGQIESIELTLANDRYLAEDVIAQHPVPSFDRSAFDGYAIRSNDTQQASFDNRLCFKVIESVAAGEIAQSNVNINEAIRIMTGAQMPEGSDAVVALEACSQLSAGDIPYIQLNRAIEAGKNVSKKGEDIKQGKVICKKGSRISAGEMAMLATFGYAKVKVYKQPVIGIYATGKELLPVDEQEPIAGRIRDSNSYMLISQIERLGAIPKYLGILPDEFDTCYQAIQTAFQEVDYLITTGGASVGDYDYIESIIKKMGTKQLFNKVAMRPGSVTTVAVTGEKWLFGLSGNPSACYVGFELFAGPVIKRALGSDSLHLSSSKAVITHEIAKPTGVTRYIRAKAGINGYQVEVSTIGLDKSGISSSLVETNVILVLQPRGHGVKRGEIVDILWIESLM